MMRPSVDLAALAEDVDNLARPVYGPYSFVREMLSPGMTLLDVGCGNGKVSAYLAESGAIIDGVEPSPTRSGVAVDRVRYLSRVPAGEHDPELLPTYDVITFFDVVEHITDPQSVLDWAASKVAPGGALVLSIPNSGHYSFRLKMIKGDWSMQDWGLFDRTHVRFFDLQTMADLAPVGTCLDSRAYFSPDATTWTKRRRLERVPSLFALHGLLVWRKS